MNGGTLDLAGAYQKTAELSSSRGSDQHMRWEMTENYVAESALGGKVYHRDSDRV